MALDTQFQDLKTMAKPDRGPAIEDDVFAAPPSEEELAASEADIFDAPPTAEEMALVSGMKNYEPFSYAEMAEAAIGHTANAATMGYLPQLEALAAPVQEGIEEVIRGRKLTPEEKQRLTEEFREQRLKDLRERNPWASFAGEVVGASATGKVIARQVPFGGSKIGDVAEEAAAGAIEGAAYDPKETGMTRMEGAGLGAGFGAGATVGIKGGAKVAQKAIIEPVSKVGPKFLSSIFGVPEKYILEHLKNPDLINKARNIDELVQFVDDIAGAVRREVNDGKLDYADANRKMEDLRKFYASEFKDKTKEINDAFRYASRKLDEDFRLYQDQLNKVQPPTHLDDDIVQALDDLRERVTVGSDQALNIAIAEVPGPIDVPSASKPIEDAMVKYTKDGEVLPSFRDVYSRLQIHKDTIDMYGGQMTASEIKTLSKEFDKISREFYQRPAGGFTKTEVNVLVNVRRYLDSILKSKSSGYTKMMAEVAHDAEILHTASKALGNEKARWNFLNGIDRPSRHKDRLTLYQLGETMGRNFEEDVREFLDVRNEIRTLRTVDGKRVLMQELDSWTDFAKAKAMVEARRKISDWERNQILDRQVMQSQEAAQREAAQVRWENAVVAMDEIKSFNGQNGESRLGALMKFYHVGPKGTSAQVRQEFEKLVTLSDKEFTDLMSDLPKLDGAESFADFEEVVKGTMVRTAFDKSYPAGSKYVNLFAAMGMAADSSILSGTTRTAAGGATGSWLGGPLGLIMGVTVGPLVDRYGGAMTKKILDGVIAIKGVPTMNKIMHLSLPTPVKLHLAEEFKNFISSGWSGQGITLEPADAAMIKEDIRRDSNMLAVDKAVLIDQINRTGRIDSPELIWGTPEPKQKSDLERYVDELGA